MHKLHTKLIAKLLLPAAALAFCAALAADTVVEDIIARVNSQIITRSELQRSREQAKKEMLDQQVPPTEIALKEKDTLRDLIDRQLLIQKGADLGISPDAEVVKRLDEMRKQMGLESMEDLDKAAQQQGISFEEFKQQMRDNIVTQRVVSEEVGRRLNITPEETRQYYNAHTQEFNRPEEVSISEILISTDKSAKNPSADETQRIAAAQAKAQSIYAQLKKGAKWDELAKTQSDGSTAQGGGDLGQFKRGQLAKELEDKVFLLKQGNFTEPLRTKQGFILLRADQHQAAGVPPLKEVEQDVQNAIYVQKLQPALREYLTKLREDAFIEIKPGFADTGASPNQTKPVYLTAANADTSAKKQKKHKKLGIF